MGDGPGDVALMERALAVRQAVVRTYPAVGSFQLDLARSHRLLAGSLARAGQTSEALDHYTQARGLLKELAADNPAVPEYRFELAWVHNHLGRLYARQGRFAEAFAELDEGLAIRQELAAADPGKALYADHLGYSYAYRAAAHVRAGHPAEAAADLRQALGLWEKEKDANTETRFERARALLAGLGADAKSGVGSAEAAGLADQAVAALRDAVNGGWAESCELKEPEFDPLRRRDDFQQLVKELEAKAAAANRPKDDGQPQPEK
jgi:tetratricopeptide (TPR) repeat protein